MADIPRTRRNDSNLADFSNTIECVVRMRITKVLQNFQYLSFVTNDNTIKFQIASLRTINL